MDEKIYRKKSLDRIKSPESLNDYVRVSNPGVWLVLAAVIALLAGACIWGIFGQIETTVEATAVVSGGEAVCIVSDEEIYSGMKLRIGKWEGKIDKAEYGTMNGQAAARITAHTDVPDGTYKAKIITESVKPISFVLN